MNWHLMKMGVCVSILMILSGYNVVFAQAPDVNHPMTDVEPISYIKTLARLTTVRILTRNASGSGVIIQRQGRIYTVMTNWHVLASVQQPTVMVHDGEEYELFGAKKLGNADLAIAYFDSLKSYTIAPISQENIRVGEIVFASGFPMYEPDNFQTTFDRGLKVFRLTQGTISILPPKSLPEGYRLGYTNDIKIGMSGGPIFNHFGQLIGINGRIKSRDPGFGVYTFEDGTEPSEQMLELMVNSSWGIPINSHWKDGTITDPAILSPFINF